MPAGLTLVSMTGTGYDCTTTPGTCVASAALPAGAGEPITVTAILDASFTGSAKNVAYVSPSSADLVAETVPLVVPSLTTDTTSTPTDKDSEAVVSVAKVSIGDLVWYDTNRDGQQSAGEPVVEDGMVVNLLHADGTPVLDAAGNPVSTTTLGGYYALIYFFVQSKFWTLFSLLFGMGFAVMIERAARAGRPFEIE